MMGGDDIPGTYENTFRKMAEGVADGVNGVNNNDGNADYSTTLMSYHPPKWSHSSSYWFPNDAFMDFNSTQDQPSDQINRIWNDWGLTQKVLGFLKVDMKVAQLQVALMENGKVVSRRIKLFLRVALDKCTEI
jgi:hypothetical protein